MRYWLTLPFKRGRRLERLPFPVEEPPPRHPLLGRVLGLAGIVLIVVGFFSAGVAANGVIGSVAYVLLPVFGRGDVFQEVGIPEGLSEAVWPLALCLLAILAGGVLSVLAFAKGMQLRDRGRRLRLRDARKVLRRPGRPIVLLLRSFGDDELIDPSPVNLIQPRYEERLTKVLARLGSVVTVGRPGESFGFSGAARLYVTDARWREAVRYLMGRATAIVIIVGKTEGLWWEIMTVLNAFPRQRLLFFFPYVLDADQPSSSFGRFKEFLARWNLPRRRYQRMNQERRERYRHFAERLSSECGLALPENIGYAQFLDFSSDGNPRLLKDPFRQLVYLLPTMWPNLLFPPRFRRAKVNIRRTLRAFIRKVQRSGDMDTMLESQSR